jgi:hypothetical protein
MHAAGQAARFASVEAKWVQLKETLKLVFDADNAAPPV